MGDVTTTTVQTICDGNGRNAKRKENKKGQRAPTVKDSTVSFSCERLLFSFNTVVYHSENATVCTAFTFRIHYITHITFKLKQEYR